MIVVIVIVDRSKQAEKRAKEKQKRSKRIRASWGLWRENGG
jgi:hypothetical protein